MGRINLVPNLALEDNLFTFMGEYYAGKKKLTRKNLALDLSDRVLKT